MKTCSLCGDAKPLDEFRRDKNRPDGRRAHCKSCASKMDRAYKQTLDPERRREHDARYRARNKDSVADSRQRWRAAHRDKQKAHWTLEKAVRSGRAVRPDACERCNAAGVIQGHHHDYSRPLDVEWLCVPCHKQLHARDEQEDKP